MLQQYLTLGLVVQPIFIWITLVPVRFNTVLVDQLALKLHQRVVFRIVPGIMLLYVDSTTWYFFWDGVAQTTPTTGSLTANLTTDICGTTALRLGENYPSSAGYKDYIDEFRLSVGICRWTSNFTIY